MSDLGELQPGSVPSLVYGILYQRRHWWNGVSAARLSLLAHVDVAQVSNALQRLKKLGLARYTTRGWRDRVWSVRPG